MKKWILAPALALLLLAAGCGGQQTTKQSSSTQTSSAKKADASSKTASSKAESSADSSSATASTSSSAPATKSSNFLSEDPATLNNRNKQVRQSIPDALLPTVYPTGNQALNVGFTGNSANYSVYYATTPRSGANPTRTVSAGDAEVALQKKTYTTAAAAEASINYQAPEVGLPTVALGDGITATTQGAAGSTYTSWQEGRWGLSVQAINQNNEDGTALAKQVVALLAKEWLPIPAGHGAIHLRVAAGGQRLNTVTWRSGNAVYAASGDDAMTLMQVVTSLK